MKRKRKKIFMINFFYVVNVCLTPSIVFQFEDSATPLLRERGAEYQIFGVTAG
jgi:hypothetical protein